jgi:hypothetical protein
LFSYAVIENNFIAADKEGWFSNHRVATLVWLSIKFKLEVFGIR